MLELLLAARHSLYLSHTGRSVRDNTPLPPSVLVAELLDLLLPAIADDPSSAQSLARARGRLVVEHPLQPFALSAFDAHGDPRLRSYNRELADALRGSLEAPRRLPQPAAAVDDDADEDDAADDGDEDGSAGELASALLPRPAARARARMAAGVAGAAAGVLSQPLPRTAAPPAGHRPGPRRGRAAGRRALPARRAQPCRAGRSVAAAAVEGHAGCRTCWRWPMPAPRCPTARSAKASCSASCNPCRPSRPSCARRRPSRRCRRTPTRWTWRWTAKPGSCSGPSPTCAPPACCAGATGRRVPATAWPPGCSIWRCVPRRPDGVALRTRWLSSDGEFSLEPCDDAAEILRDLLALYRQGLSEPLHFYPRSAWAFQRKGPGAARAAWQSARGLRRRRRPGLPAGAARRRRPARRALRGIARAVYGPLRVCADERE